MRPLALPLMLALCACSPAFQTTSGTDYLAARADSAVMPDPSIRQAADIEGDLRLPARIGLVRLLDGQITDFPADELALLDDLGTGAAAAGTFQPVSLLVGSTLRTAHDTPVIDRARLIGARQHLDYLLVISHNMATNAAEALFVDVRNGYPYATAQVSDNRAPLGRWPSAQSANRRAEDLTRALIPDLTAMMNGLIALAAQP